MKDDFQLQDSMPLNYLKKYGSHTIQFHDHSNGNSFTVWG